MTTDFYHIDHRGDVVIATIDAGDLTHREAGELLDELAQYKQQTGARFFVLDMAKVSFIDSACIGLLVTFLIDVDKSDGRIALADCHPMVAELIRVTGLTVHIHLSEDVEQAVTDIAA
jgi:anti-anti-sigma factor